LPDSTGVAPNQVFKWRQLYAEGALSAVGSGEEVVAASEYRALQHHVRELFAATSSAQQPSTDLSGYR
jgi:transposase-like protein